MDCSIVPICCEEAPEYEGVEGGKRLPQFSREELEELVDVEML